MKRGLLFLFSTVLGCMLLTGCAHMGSSEEENVELQALQLLRDYEAAVGRYDAEAAMAMLSDDYTGFRGAGKESVENMVQRFEDNGNTMLMDLTEAKVVDQGDTVRVEDVGVNMGRWDMTQTYILARTEAGMKIKGVEFRRPGQ